MIDVTNGLRSPRLSRSYIAKLLWLYIAPVLADGRSMPVKVRVTAALLGMKRRSVRLAIAHLVEAQLLDCTRPATGGTPGEYRLGAAAFATRSPRLPRSREHGASARAPGEERPPQATAA